MELKGVWLPVVTPFINNEVDYESYRKLLNFYIDKKISGIIPLGTTGESPAIEDDEFLGIIETTIETSNGTVYSPGETVVIMGTFSYTANSVTTSVTSGAMIFVYNGSSFVKVS